MDRLTEMEAFATVVDQGGFTDAARKMGISKSAVSKHVSSLETRLGTRLLNRTTRRVSPTEIGLAYYDRARRVLNDAGEADSFVTSMQAAPNGLLRVGIVADLAVRHVSPVLGILLARYPGLTVCLDLTSSRPYRRIGEFDVTVGLGNADEGGPGRRKIAETTTRMVAAPSYIARMGRPRRIDGLNDHKLLHYSHSSTGNVWRLTAPSGEVREVRSPGFLMVNDGQSLLNAAIGGLGIAYLPNFLYARAAREGLVEEAMPDLPVEVQSLCAVYPPGRYTQPKVRAFVDFLAESFGGNGIGDW